VKPKIRAYSKNHRLHDLYYETLEYIEDKGQIYKYRLLYKDELAAAEHHKDNFKKWLKSLN